MKRTPLTTVGLLAIVLMSTPVPAQTTPGAAGTGSAPTGKVAAWQLMTPQERTAHQDRMRAMKSYDECKDYVQQQRQLAEQRAADKGVALMTPRVNPCDQMKSRGRIK